MSYLIEDDVSVQLFLDEGVPAITGASKNIFFFSPSEEAIPQIEQQQETQTQLILRDTY
ncbi:hypothetical protein IQ235_08130 [Oscillatoriales cyanobacterium LEGE 11467]|uniref:Uncharacterized protein n=1 Tax=Zarconia navalis LEGE 11467 TaxID=1828826 RepID=A0A928VZX0_9CYAN|nr:hypothetical protein [Zarconia navalis]MBE9040745.1 hypothetical protein [Zarconia navalis LEGE 11467]